MNHSQAHAYVELAEKTHEKAEEMNTVAKAITASQAFRHYQWLQKIPNKAAWNVIAPQRNAAANFRGIVVSGRWRAAFDVTVKTGEWLERVGTFLNVVGAVIHSYDEVERIITSREPTDVKAAKLGAQLTGVAMYVFTGLVTPTARVLLTSMPIQGYCDAVDLARGVSIGTCSQSARNIDVAIEMAAEEVSDGDEIYSWINTEINPRVSRAFGF